MTYIADSITDAIGNEYEQWKRGDVVFISSPTGSGKTWFVLNVLLKYLAGRGQKMLYLVNRTVLKEQLDEEKKRLPFELRNCIDVVLYQTIESRLLELKFDGTFLWRNYHTVQKYLAYDCVVCDEAHYFMMDSNYNTNTILSYKFIADCFKEKIRIYMSATIAGIKEFIERDSMKNIHSSWLGYHLKDTTRIELMRSGKIYNYGFQRKYENIEIGILKERDEIKDLVVNGKEKWLVFVDSKIFGKTLATDIKAAFEKKAKENAEKKSDAEETVVFVTSDYDVDGDATEVVETIVTEGKQSPKVLITTSVLDNGINIKDIALRNIIIVADTEVEFIQMLGRKRNDGTLIKLYIYKHVRNHFVKRNRLNARRLELADAYHKPIEEQMKIYEAKSNKTKLQVTLDQVETGAICSQHQILMSKLMNNKVAYDDIRTLFLAVDGFFVLNMLSFENLKNLDKYYVELFNKFDKYGDDAYVREQLSWLGKSEDEIDKIISDANKSSYELSREKVIQELERVCDVRMSREEFTDFKNEIANHLEVLVKCMAKDDKKYDTYINICTRTDRTITDEFMKCLKTYCNIPFAVKRGKYTITRATE